MINLFVKLFVMMSVYSGLLLSINPTNTSSTRIFKIDNEEITVTHDVDIMFYGLYKGQKSGYLLLNSDGTGEYKYDISGVLSPGCEDGIIQFEWGMPVNQENKKVQFKKHYGYSFPVIFKCTGEICFQGCTRVYLLDFILDKGDGKLHVSSSDDWKKIK